GCIEMLLPLAAYGAIAMVKERPVSDLLTSLRAASVPILMVASLVLSGSRGGVLVLGLEVLAGWAVVRSIAPAAARLGAWLIGGVLAASVLLVSWHPLLIRVEGLAFRDPS